MKSNQIILGGLLAVAIGVGSLLAQDPPSPPDPAMMAQHRVQMLTKMLSLTSDQQKQALTIFTNAATSESGLHDSMKTAHEALDTAVKANDGSAISQAATTIGNLTAESTTIHAKADAAFYAILTADQQTKFGQFEARHHGRGPGFGPMHDGPPANGFMGGGPNN